MNDTNQDTGNEPPTDQCRGLRPCTIVYLTLMALTGVTYMVGQLGLTGLSAALPILFLALLKGQMVGDYFMGLKAVRGPWRWVVFLWLLIPGTLITIAFVNAAS
jgi:hypothetical protein